MLLTVPVSVADHGLIPNLIKAISLFPPGDNHDLLIIGTERNQESMGELEKGIGSWFRSSRVHVADTNLNALGWPREGNFLFQQAAHIIHSSYNPKEGFLWFELDCTPISKNWLSTISSEYYKEVETSTRAGTSPRRYMGVKQRTYETLAGELMAVEESGYHMAPCGVYPNDMAMSVKTLMAITAIGRPFVEHIQWYVTPNLNETNLIQNNWRTGNYRKENGDIVCDAKVDYGFGAKFNNPISSVIVVHGCKDGSLLELVGSGVTPTKAPEKISYPEEAFTPTPSFRMPVNAPQTFLQTPFSPPLDQYVAPRQERPVIEGLLNNNDRPLNAYSVGYVHTGEAIPEPEVTTREQKGLPRYDAVPKTIPAPVELPPLEDDFSEVIEPVSVQLIEPESPKRRTRGPGKKKQKRNISPEDRERRSLQMKEVAKLANEKRRLEKLEKQSA